jgi:large subunit ribosomal protein L12
MEEVYAALLLHKLGKEVNEDGVKKVISATGAAPDEAKVKALVAALKGVNIDEAMSKAAAVPVAVAGTPAQAGASQAEKKEEKKAEDEAKKEEEAAAGLAALFG